MSIVFEKTLKMLNWGIDQLPTSVSGVIGNLPRVYSNPNQGLCEVPMSYFSKWFDLKESFYSSVIPTITTLDDWSKKMYNHRILGFINTNTDNANLYLPVTIMPEISLLKKVFFGTAITLLTSSFVYFASREVFKIASNYFCNEQKESERNEIQNVRRATITKTVKVISGLLGLFTAVAVGRAAYATFNLSPGIYGSGGWFYILPMTPTL